MCAQVIHPRLERRRLTAAIGEPGPPPVELDHAREGGESVEEGHPERLTAEATAMARRDQL
jgi:hypothetical protein